LLLSGILLMGVGQLWDKGRSVAKHFGTRAFMHAEWEASPNPLPEEGLELLGELLVLFATLELLSGPQRGLARRPVRSLDALARQRPRAAEERPAYALGRPLG